MNKVMNRVMKKVMNRTMNKAMYREMNRDRAINRTMKREMKRTFKKNLVCSITRRRPGHISACCGIFLSHLMAILLAIFPSAFSCMRYEERAKFTIF